MTIYRATMAGLLARTRALIGDPLVDGQDPNVDELDLLAHLDAHRYEHSQMPLAAVPTYSPSGTAYLRFVADVGDWETDATFVDGTWTALVPTVSDWQAGRWTFAATPTLPVRISGQSYDLAAAGADALEGWAASAARCYDMAVDGQRLSRSQVAASLRDAAAKLRLQALPETASLIRSDMGSI